MAFCSFSSESIITNKTEVDNVFINEFLPYAPEGSVKVYLYGLYMCSHPTASDNSIESFSSVLGLAEQDIIDSYLYWQEQGLVQVLSTFPLSIKYMPIKNFISNIKKYNKEKYADFNVQAQEIIKGRMITPSEYAEYYDIIERYHFEPNALLMIISYCTSLKGDNVGYKYILTVARNWADENITTCQSVEERLKDYENQNDELGLIFKAFGSKKHATYEEHELFIKWTEKLGFSTSTIIFVAKLYKTRSIKFTFDRLDSILLKYYEMKLMSVKEIEEYENLKEGLKTLAKSINKNLGLYYDNLDAVVENYVAPWINLGFDDETLNTLATYCFKRSIRTLDGMNTTIQKLYKLGLVSSDSINSHLSELARKDQEIKGILEKLGIDRNVNQYDRENYRTWKEVWNISDELFDYGITLASSKQSAMQYLNKLFSLWHEKGFSKIDETKSTQPLFTPVNEINKKQNIMRHNHTSQELTALFDQLTDIEI